MSVLGGTTTTCVAAPAVAVAVPWAVVPVPGTVAAVAAAASAAAAAAAAVVANQKHLDQHCCGHYVHKLHESLPHPFPRLIKADTSFTLR